MRRGYPAQYSFVSRAALVAPWFGHSRSYRAARSVFEVVLAWSGVYGSYLRAGLISENPYGIHTVPQAVDPSVLVVIDSAIDRASEFLGTRDRLATVTIIPDMGRGIPLDDVYREELEQLREKGRMPIEAVLLADDRDTAVRSMETMFGLMRWAFYYGLYLKKTDLVFGVHPRHAPFYRRMLGATDIGAETTCARVRHAPVVGLRIDLLGLLVAIEKPRAINYFLKRPLARDEMLDRFELSRSSIRGSVIEGFLGLAADLHQGLPRAPLVPVSCLNSAAPQP